MASGGPDRVPRTPLWLPACKVIALRLARSERAGRPSASDTSTSGTRLHRLHAGIGAGQSPVNDFADPLGPTQVGKYLATSTELISITTPRLIKAGLCEVETSLNDLRWRRLSISQKGAAVLRAIETELAQLDVLPQVSGGPHV
jgi:hypothetical protein